jgi:hypothetical protein
MSPFGQWWEGIEFCISFDSHNYKRPSTFHFWVQKEWHVAYAPLNPYNGCILKESYMATFQAFPTP